MYMCKCVDMYDDYVVLVLHDGGAVKSCNPEKDKHNSLFQKNRR
jgi:hypothetical protein